MMTDILDSITATLRERLVSPLAGSFVISWLIVNYKVVVILLSNMKPHVKFAYIEQHIWTENSQTLLYGLIYPLAAALSYIFIYPWPARWLMQYSLYQQNKTKLARIHGERKIPLDKADFDELKNKANDKINKLGQEIQRLEAQLESTQKKEETSKSNEQLMAVRANELYIELEKLKATHLETSSSISTLMGEREELRLRSEELQAKLNDSQDTISSLILRIQERKGEVGDAFELENTEAEEKLSKGRHFRFRNATGIGAHNFVSEFEIIQYLKKFRDLRHPNIKITERIIKNFEVAANTLNERYSNELYSQIKAKKPLVVELSQALEEILDQVLIAS